MFNFGMIPAIQRETYYHVNGNSNRSYFTKYYRKQ